MADRNATGRGGAGTEEMEEIGETLRALKEEAREAAERLVEQLELERRMRERPLQTLGMAAAAGFILGGGLWPVLRPFAKAWIRAAISPANLLAMGVGLAMRSVERDRTETVGEGAPSHS
jgi:hypothetical protein